MQHARRRGGDCSSVSTEGQAQTAASPKSPQEGGTEDSNREREGFSFPSEGGKLCLNSV